MHSTTERSAVSGSSNLTTADSEEILRRLCFGHVAFIAKRQVNVVPIRYAFDDGWVYFRADATLRDVIARSRWAVLSVTELRDTTGFASVIVRGGCYPAEATGSTAGDAAALRGILALRDRPRVGPTRAPRVQRVSTVFRLHVEDLQGSITFVPCPAGSRAYDALEVQHLRTVGRDHTADEDSRADDDGMAEPNPPGDPRSDGVTRTR
jgi:nitroimidazol reductase NimA-like FMN-containing flavoprotein (pyridoxamine 5'-phosphate oxidase superfamily)